MGIAGRGFESAIESAEEALSIDGEFVFEYDPSVDWQDLLREIQRLGTVIS